LIKYILGALACGGVVGYVNNAQGSAEVGGFVSSYLYSSLLILLLFVMGFEFGANREALVKLRKAGLKILVVPLSIALGSITGGLIGGYILGLNMIGTMAVTAGFGWYTMAGPLIGELLGPSFEALGFAVNFMREILAIVTAPLLAKVDRYSPIAFGGATTMDTTLPIITRYCGSESLVAAFSSGFTLSLAAPFAITAIAALQ
jgi:uncharacterized membrane protein YbjE (DUF340 family)